MEDGAAPSRACRRNGQKRTPPAGHVYGVPEPERLSPRSSTAPEVKPRSAGLAAPRMERHEPQQPIAQPTAPTSRALATAFWTMDIQHLLELLGLIRERPLRLVGAAGKFFMGQCVLMCRHRTTFAFMDAWSMEPGAASNAAADA